MHYAVCHGCVRPAHQHIAQKKLYNKDPPSGLTPSLRQLLRHAMVPTKTHPLDANTRWTACVSSFSTSVTKTSLQKCACRMQKRERFPRTLRSPALSSTDALLERKEDSMGRTPRAANASPRKKKQYAHNESQQDTMAVLLPRLPRRGKSKAPNICTQRNDVTCAMGWTVTRPNERTKVKPCTESAIRITNAFFG